MAISRTDARVVTDEVIKAITPILEAHGLKMGSHRSNYGDRYAFRFDASTVVLGEDGFDYGTKEAQDWLFYGSLKDFESPKDVLGKVVVMRGEQWEFMGYAPRSPKYPLRFKKVVDGRVYKFTDSALRYLR